MSDEDTTTDAVDETVDEQTAPETGDKPDTDAVTMSKAEADALRREVAESRRNAKKAKDAAEAAERKRLADEGEFKTLAEQAEQRAVDAEQRAARLEQRQLIGTVAGRLKFRDAADAAAHLQAQGVEITDEQSVENALRALATEKPYLIDTPGPSRTGLSADQQETTGKVTAKELAAMTPQQVAELPQDVIRAALAAA